MQNNIIIGIDISAKTLDIAYLEGDEYQHKQIKNNPKTIHNFFAQFVGSEVMIAMENTGRYNWQLYDVLPEFDFKVFVIHPLHLSKSLGLTRGKNDKVDAIRIAQFISKHHEELPQWKPCSNAVKGATF